MSVFGQKLKKLRTDKDLTQSKFGSLFNLSKQTISGYEKGDATPPIETLQKFADFFGVTTDELLGRDTYISIKINQKFSKDELTKMFESLPLEEQKAFLKKYINSVLS
jgi:transcriptional regulator with XRE-family HTH domain